MIKFKKILVIFSSLILMNCTTIKSEYAAVNKISEKIKTKKNESAFVIEEDKKGNKFAKLKSIYILGGTIIGDISFSKENDIIFNIKSIRLISSWNNGWTSGECKAAGKITFKNENNNLCSIVDEPFELNDAVKGEIRYMDIYYRGEVGKIKFKQRIDRISEVVKFLKTKSLKKNLRQCKK